MLFTYMRLLSTTVLCIFLCASAYAGNLTTQLSRDTVAAGETVTITYTLSNARNNITPDLSPLEQDFRILGTNYGNTIKIINGDTQTQIFWKIILIPKKTGELIIPEISFGDLKSTTTKLTVKNSGDMATNDTETTSTFVTATVNATSPYVQSEVIYTFKLYYRNHLQTPRLEVPQLKDGLLIEAGEDKTYQTQVKGEEYFVYEKNFAFFPNKPGQLTITPTRFSAAETDTNFGFTNDIFAMANSQLVTLATKPISLTVQNIPDNFTGSEWLPAKNISLTEKWSAKPEQWEQGNPIIRTVKIEATGLRGDQLPGLSIENISGINVYVDKPQRSNNIVDHHIVGVLEQKITYIPQVSKAFTIPEVRLAWWDTQNKVNASTSLPEVKVTVKPTMNKSNVTANDIPSITNAVTPSTHSNNGVLNTRIPQQSSRYYQSYWFWISLGLFTAWLITLGLYLRNKAMSKMTSPSLLSLSAAPTLSYNEKQFAQACEQGDVITAQKFLLHWAQTQLPEPPHNLAKLRNMIHDEDLKQALANLEQALYANNLSSWNGYELLAAYKKAQRNKKQLLFAKTPMKQNTDLLPPLNP